MSTMNPTVKKLMPWVPLVVALIIGLVLGLLIGWVWWPVSWTNAGVADLSPAQQAAYVSAVAEAYRLDGTQDAAQSMQARLAPFGADVDEAVVNAIEYYRGLPVPDETAVATLSLLATDLNISVDAAMIAAAPGTTAEEALNPAVDGAAEETAAEAAAPASRGRLAGILTWILAIILSAGLIGAGFYLLMRLRTPHDLTDSMKDPSTPSSPGSLQPVAGGTSRTSAWGKNGDSGASSAASIALADDDDLSFDDDEEPAVRFSGASGDMGAPDADDELTSATPRYASARDDAESFSSYTGASFDASNEDDADDPFADDDDPDDDLEDDAGDVDGGEPQRRSAAPAAVPAARAALVAAPCPPTRRR